jgi:hypothetical protein
LERRIIPDIGGAGLRIFSIVPGDLSPGTPFFSPVRALVEKTIPSVSGPPGNSAGFQARAVHSIALKSREADFERPLLRTLNLTDSLTGLTIKCANLMVRKILHEHFAFLRAALAVSEVL